MAKDNKIYVTGHKNPHADSVAAAIAYAVFKNEQERLRVKEEERLRAKEQGRPLTKEEKIEPRFEWIPCVLDEIDKESQYLLNRFGFEKPIHLKTAQASLGEIELDPPIAITPETTIMETVHMMAKEEREGFAVINEEREIVGWISRSDLAKLSLGDTSRSDNLLKETPTEYFAKTIDGKILYDDEERHLNGQIDILTMTSKEKLGGIDVKDRIVITGPDTETIGILIEKGAGMLVIINGEELDEGILQKAKDHHCSIILSGHGAMNTSRFIYFAPPVRMVMTKNPMKFYVNQLAEEAGKKMGSTEFRAFPVVDEEEHLVGYLTRKHVLNYKDKMLILVDHNEFSRSVKGVEKARVLEVIDHHKVMDFSTPQPVSFRNENVGSTCTIIASIFGENQVLIEENLAGLMLGALLSDTMNLKTPTTTERDKATAATLATVAGLDLDEFTKEFFSQSYDKGMSMEERIKSDIIFHDYMGIRLMITKMNVPEVELYKEMPEEMQHELDVLTKKMNVDLGILSITSAQENKSILFSSGNKAEWLFEAFPKEKDEPYSVQDGMVSRQTQLLPKLEVVIDKYA